MCGRFSQLPIDLQAGISRAIAGAGDLPEIHHDLAELPPRFNLAPTQRAGVVLVDEGEALVRRLIWGLLPPWSKDAKSSYTTINARIETVATKPAFRSAFKARRCLVPMAGYFEWTGVKGSKQPWFLHETDHQPLWAAGLWEPRHRTQADDQPGTFTIITATARDVAGRVHDRMPVFLQLDQLRAWAEAEPPEAQAMLEAAALPPIDLYPVSTRVNGPKHDDASLLERIPEDAVVGPLP